MWVLRPARSGGILNARQRRKAYREWARVPEEVRTALRVGGLAEAVREMDEFWRLERIRREIESKVEWEGMVAANPDNPYQIEYGPERSINE